jgi:integrase
MDKFRTDYRTKYSATRTNGAMTVIREMLELAKKDGILGAGQLEELLDGWKYVKVNYDYKRLTLELPTPAEVVALRNAVYRRCLSNGSRGGWLFDFLLFSGSRIEAATDVRWRDIDFRKSELFFRNAKYGNYSIPLFPDLRELLERIQKATQDAKPDDRVLTVKSIQTVMTSASREIWHGKKHLSHHDLRHIFATRCLEADKNVVTVASWLGHKDNGRTVILVYGHVRKGYSHTEAAEMRFLPAVAENTPTITPQDTQSEAKKGDEIASAPAQPLACKV